MFENGMEYIYGAYGAMFIVLSIIFLLSWIFFKKNKND